MSRKEDDRVCRQVLGRMSRASLSQYHSSVTNTNNFIDRPLCSQPLVVDKAPRARFSTMSTALIRRHLRRAQGPSSVLPRRTLHASAISRARTRVATDNDHSFDVDDVDEDDERHTTSFGWEMIRQQKQFHDYMRAIERDAPVLLSPLLFLNSTPDLAINSTNNTF